MGEAGARLTGLVAGGAGGESNILPGAIYQRGRG
jgi:hypothetical protein